MNRNARAVDLALAYATENKFDVVAISDPNLRIIKGKSYIYIYSNSIGSSCIVKVNGSISFYSMGEGKYFVAFEMDKYMLYSVYISPNCDFKEFVEMMEELDSDIKSRNKLVIVAGDFNTKNTA